MNKLTIVNKHLAYPEVTLQDPTTSHYILLAAEVDKAATPFHIRTSSKKKALLAYCKEQCAELQNMPGVLEAVTFKAIVTAPGRGAFVKRRVGQVHVAKYDVAILIEVADAATAAAVQAVATFTDMHQKLRDAASYVYSAEATNVKRIGAVDHTRQGVFLFNYFFADEPEQNIAVWHYTAGYFQKETGLDNSTVLQPLERGPANYSIINHCRWDKLSDIMPTLLFKKSFHAYVLENFEANNTAAMPILYKLA
jgi:hypothetical protein